MIPKKFSLVNKKYIVRVVTTKQLQAHIDKDPKGHPLPASEICGLTDTSAQRIFLNRDTHEDDSDMEHTFWHEFVHALKFANGETDHDEQEVDRLGGMLHQFAITAEGHSWASCLP